MNSPIYRVDVAGGSLMLSESRKIARLLLASPEQEAWRQAIEAENLLQKRSPGTAKRIASLIRLRLQAMPPELWHMVAEGSKELASQAVMAAVVKQSPLLRDFMRDVVAERYRLFETHLSHQDWASFIQACEHRDPGVSNWLESSRDKLREVIFRMLAEAGYVDRTKTLKLQAVHVVPELENLLRKIGEEEVLACLRATS